MEGIKLIHVLFYAGAGATILGTVGLVAGGNEGAIAGMLIGGIGGGAWAYLGVKDF